MNDLVEHNTRGYGILKLSDALHLFLPTTFDLPFYCHSVELWIGLALMILGRGGDTSAERKNGRWSASQMFGVFWWGRYQFKMALRGFELDEHRRPSGLLDLTGKKRARIVHAFCMPMIDDACSFARYCMASVSIPWTFHENLGSNNNHQNRKIA